MLKSPVHPSMTRTSAPHAWRRLALAAFVVALYTSLALSSGVARADEGTSASGTESGTTGATTSDTATSGTSHVGHGHVGHSQVGHGVEARTAQGCETAELSPARSGVRRVGRTGLGPPSAARRRGAAEAPGEVPTPIDATEPDATEPEAAPSTPPLADVAHKSRTSSRPAPEVPSARTERPLRSVSSPADTSPPGTSPTDTSPADSAATDSTPADTARVGAHPTAASTAVAPPRPASATPPNLALQLAGGLSDVGTITVSVVHAVATAVAHAFGPDSFLGVPYLLATAVANTAAAVGRTLVGATLTEPSAGQFAVNYGSSTGWRSSIRRSRPPVPMTPRSPSPPSIRCR